MNVRRVRLALGIVVVSVGCAAASVAPTSPLESATRTAPAPTTTTTAVVPSPSAAPTESFDPQGIGIQWRIYSSAALGLAFEYPYSSTSRGMLPLCAPRELNDGVSLDRFGVSVSNTSGTADTAATAFLAGRSDLLLEARGPTTIGGISGTRIEVRTVGLARYGTITFVVNRGRLYKIAWDAGNFDCNPVWGFSGPQVYGHLVDTMHFLP